MWRELYVNAVMHSYYMLNAVKEVRGITCHVYGHTSGSSRIDPYVVANEDKVPSIYAIQDVINTARVSGYSVVYDIANDDMSTKETNRRYATIMGSGSSICYGNRDGAAIKLVTHKFKSQSGKRILFVMSDGAPTDYGWGENAYHITRSEANKAREQGIEVYSLSLTKYVIPTTNKIYGEEYNYDLSKMENLIGIADAIIGKTK
jgi:hypothetical protein